MDGTVESWEYKCTLLLENFANNSLPVGGEKIETFLTKTLSFQRFLNLKKTKMETKQISD